MANAQRQDIDLGITRYEYGDPDRKQVALLQIETGKYFHGGLASHATVYWVGRSCRQRLMGLGGDGGDYDKRLRIARELKATQRAIDGQHAQVFTPEVIAQLTEAAKAHYAAVVRAGVDGFHNTYPASAGSTSEVLTTK